MPSSKIDKLLARQLALKDAIREEKRHDRLRKQKALFTTVKRLGLLDLEDDEVEAALQAYKTLQGDGSET